MDYTNALKQLREYKKLKIKDIELGKSRMAYSRIENKQSKLNTQDLDNILKQMDITLEEFAVIKNTNSKFSIFLKELHSYVNTKKSTAKKEYLLSTYYNPKNIAEKSKEELAIFLILNLTFQNDKSLKKLSTTTINKIYEKTINQPYYSELDYRIATHLVTLITDQQRDKLANLFFPIKHEEIRNKATKKNAYFLIINIASISIYNQNYKKAIYYLELLENTLIIQDNYYIHLLLTFHKNLALYLLTKETIYIEKIRHLIRLIEDLNDLQLAKTFELELNNLTKNATHYSNNKNVEITSYRD